MHKPTFAGWHLIYDAIVRDPGWIGDIERIRSFLLGLVPRLDMELLEGPRITEVSLDPSQLTSEQDDGGITGYALITTSHLSIHTWPLRNRFSLDVFSCRPFDAQIVLDFVQYADDPSEAYGLGQLTVGPIAAPRANYPIGVKVEYKDDGTIAVVARDAETGEELEQSFGGDPSGDVRYLADQRKALQSILMTRP